MLQGTAPTHVDWASPVELEKLWNDESSYGRKQATAPEKHKVPPCMLAIAMR